MSSYLTEENCSLNDEGRIAFVILFISQLLQGIGCSSYYTLGAAYLDDNVVKNKFPFLFGESNLREIWVTSISIAERTFK